ncbi:MAG: 4Fe-4S binding protein [Spirochaetales bacterium]|nr:4Fe-4S binding protein [Spirochaetales bacterium]
MPTRKVFFYFPQCQTETPLVYHFVKDYDLKVNLFRAKVNAEEEGYLVLDLTGEQEQIDRAIHYAESLGVQVRTNNKGLSWNRERCTGCSNCLPHCPTGALYREEESRVVAFDGDKCVECLACVDNCPFGACTSFF